MIDSIIIFYGPTTAFDTRLQNDQVQIDDATTFVELIQHYNARIRPGDSGVKEVDLAKKLTASVCIVRTDDYSSVLDHVLLNFAGIVTRNYDIGTLYLQNPPKQVYRSICGAFPDNVAVVRTPYTKVTRDILRKTYATLCTDVLGQESCKKQLMGGLYKATTLKRQRPIVLMLYGPSGVGKTETAKSISQSFGGELLRIQFSMMQSNEAFDYIFGAEHSKGSFARDMLARESNVILIDEFDKVNPRFYNAFYELFDEGRFTDMNYTVDVPNAVFLLTCNFLSEAEIKSALGPAMFSRIDLCIKYDDLSTDQKKKIVENWYRELLEDLSPDEQQVIQESNILSWFESNADRYDNIRILKTKLENAVYTKLATTFVLQAGGVDETSSESGM